MGRAHHTPGAAAPWSRGPRPPQVHQHAPQRADSITNAAAGRWNFSEKSGARRTRQRPRRPRSPGPYGSSSMSFPHHRLKRPRRSFPLLASGASAPLETCWRAMLRRRPLPRRSRPCKSNTLQLKTAPRSPKRRSAPESWADTEVSPPFRTKGSRRTLTRGRIGLQSESA